MFHILVADDERVTRRGIVALLERGVKEDIEIIEAANGAEALEITKNQMIHMIITDICMPVLSGLDFVSKLRETDEQMTVIIISAYDNFDYAKQAVKLGVKDYVMKPVHKENLLSLVENCIADIQKRQEDVQAENLEAFKRSLLVKEIREELSLQILFGRETRHNVERLRALDVPVKGNYYFAASLEYEWAALDGEVVDRSIQNIVEEFLEMRIESRFLSVITRSKQIGILFWSDEHDERKTICKTLADLVRTIEELCRIKAVVGIGNVVYEAQEYARSFKQAQLASECKVFGNFGKIILYEDIPKGDARRIRISDKLFGEYHLKALRERFRDGMTIANIKEIRRSYESLQEINKSVEWKTFSDFWSEFELLREVREFWQFMDNDTEGDEGSGKYHQLINEIVNFTKEHLTEDVDLTYVADTFGKTPGYIGTLFKKEQGLGFNEFVTRERMVLAKRYLHDPSLSIQEVGALCGYYNPKYFSSVFKKVVGMSPKTYQMMMKREE